MKAVIARFYKKYEDATAEAIKMIIAGVIEPVVKALPLEYAVELNKLIELEVEGL